MEFIIFQHVDENGHNDYKYTFDRVRTETDLYWRNPEHITKECNGNQVGVFHVKKD